MPFKIPKTTETGMLQNGSSAVVVPLKTKTPGLESGM